MPLGERDAYIKLLCLNWQEERLENDPKQLGNEREMLAAHCREWTEKMDDQIGLRSRTATVPSSSPIHPNKQSRTIRFI